MSIEIILNGKTQTVSKHQLFALASRGTIGPETPLSIDGKLTTVGKVKGITFGGQASVASLENDGIYGVANTPPETKQKIEIILDGVSRAITKEQLITLAAQGRITPDTPVSVNGTFMTAGNVQGIAFGLSTPQNTSGGRQTSAPPTMTVFLNGVEQVITTEQLHNLAARGIIRPDTPINVNGKLVPAGQAKGIVFGQPQHIAEQVPYPPVSPISPVPVPTDSTTGYDYRHIASLHRLSTWSILVFLLASQIALRLRGCGPPILEVIGGILTLGVIGFSIFCVVRLAKSLQYGTGATVSFALCIFPGIIFLIPAFIPLILVYHRANKTLKQAGYKVGSVGADMRQFGDRVPLPEGVQELFYWLIIIVTVFLVFLGTIEKAQRGSQVNNIGSPMGQVDIVRDVDNTNSSLKNYQDNEYGFSFRYPRDWREVVRPTDMPSALVLVAGQIVDDLAPHISVNAVPAPSGLSNEDLLKVPKAAFQSLLEGQGANNMNIKGFGTKEVGGKKCLFVHYQATSGKTELPIEVLHFDFIYKGKEFIIKAMDRQASFEKNRSIFDSIISSFQLELEVEVTALDTRSATQTQTTPIDNRLTKTYQDSEYAFSFRYPENWEEELGEDLHVNIIGVDDDSLSIITVELEPPDADIFNVTKADVQTVLETAFRNVNIKDFGIKRIDNKQCLFVHYQGTTRGIPFEILSFMFLHKDKTFTIGIGGDQTSFGKNRPIFDSIINSFQFE